MDPGHTQMEEFTQGNKHQEAGIMGAATECACLILLILLFLFNNVNHIGITLLFLFGHQEAQRQNFDSDLETISGQIVNVSAV